MYEFYENGPPCIVISTADAHKEERQDFLSALASGQERHRKNRCVHGSDTYFENGMIRLVIMAR